MYLIEANHITKSFNSRQPIEVLKDISFSLSGGESLAILGASGKGKSTLLHILGTLLNPTSGEIFILGKNVKKENKVSFRQNCLGFVFQNCYLLEQETVSKNVLMPAFIAKKTKRKSIEKANLLLEKVGLSNRVDFKTKDLSGGEKQRVAIARALINDPAVILADEPTGNLDEKTSEEIQKLLLNFSSDSEKCLIVATHDLHFAKKCNHILVLKEGASL